MRLRIWLFGLIAFWLCSSACAQSAPDSTARAKEPPRLATPAPEWALTRFKLCWDALKEDSLPEKVYRKCWSDLLHSGNIGPFVDSLQTWALDGVRPRHPALLRYHSLELLSIFRNDTTQQALRSLITKKDTLDVLAAQTLIKWGDWDDAAPVLEKHALYNDLAYDQRAIPVLHRALRSADLNRRLRAAEVLYTKLDKPDSLHVIVRQVLALPSQARGTSLTKLAVDMIAKQPDHADLAVLTHLVDTDTSRWSRLGAFGAITTNAFKGDSTALAQLEVISRDCPDADLRTRAAGYVTAVRARAHTAAIPDSTETTQPKRP